MTSERVIKEAPVPVRGWNEELADYNGNISMLRRCGWACDQAYASRQLSNFGEGGRKSRLFIELSNGQTVIVRAKK